MVDFKTATVKHAMHPAVATQHLLHITIDTHQLNASEIEVSYSYALIDELTDEMRDWISAKYTWTDDANENVEKMTARDGFFTHEFYADGDVDDESGMDFSDEFKRGRKLAKNVFTSYFNPQIDKAALRVIETRFQDS